MSNVLIIVSKKSYFFLLLLTIFPFAFCVSAQSTTDTYKKLWEVIVSDSTNKQKKLYFLEVYYRKAQLENNTLEEYRALEEKSFMVPFDNAVLLLDKMRPLVEKIPNDSLKGYFLNRAAVLYYSNRFYSKALDFAIESEKFNRDINSLYNLNSIRIDIGNIYYHTRDYDKAILYFTQAKDYFQSSSDYNYRRAYVVALYNLAKTYLQLGNTNLLSETIAESKQAIAYIKPKYQAVEMAYLNYLQGGLYFLQNNDEQAKQFLEQALPLIQQNNDFNTEHIIYLYLGKIAWRQNQKSEAVKYFNMIDELFHQKNFLNYELRETYEYLIAYYKETSNTKQQLHATESLIALNKQFEREQLSITKTMHREIDTKKLEAEREQLKSVLQNKQKSTNLWLGLLGLGLVGILWYAYEQYRAKKRLKNKFDELVKQINTKALVKENPPIVSNEPGNNRPPIAVKATEARLLRELAQFENEKGYLKPVKLEELAQQWGTNRSTLSVLINTHKGSFNTYLNKLRIEQLMIDLKNQKELRRLSLTQLANQYGFANAKSLAIQFKAQTDLPPMYFIQQLEIENI
ncbi:AraC family transcriptional regulator [Avrilella dinanensis]|uniref:HTH araC/xylS-type domain-containing protein n=1 Tax=Avrilella dinanensis TaxID=2008672 RepID=A0A2M9R2K3_9FLAO|nr:AraC family transcriptional regulator [Avrilella dinanensis]PJR03015.1 hypothetical protein CDL10_11155 [Avrilella dinanensis]